MLCRINNSCFAKPFALFLLFSFLFELFFPQRFFALTSGPSQPEAAGFHPANNSQLVDPFTGKFSYNIPILSVGDYPINLSYNSNVTMDQEASWVGLGWNMNIGQITRNMRGLPDDFNGDLVKKEFNMKENLTVGGVIGKDLEIAGLEKLKALKLKAGMSLDLKYNNYTGISLGQTISAGIGARIGSESSNLVLMGSTALSTSSEGLNIQPTISFCAMAEDKEEKASGDLSVGYGISVNSRTGLQQRTLSASFNPCYYNRESFSFGNNSLFSPVSFTPQIQFPFTTTAISFSVKVGGKTKPVEVSNKYSGYFSKQKLNTNSTTSQAYGFSYLENGQNSERALLDFNREKDAPFIPGSPNLPLTYLTNDIFQIGAQGIEGTFRAYRNNTGYVFDPRVNSGSSSNSVGLELNLGSIIKGGVDITNVEISSTSSAWETINFAQGALLFNKQPENDPVSHVYYKKIGDLANGINNTYYENSGKENPIKFQLTGAANDLEVGCSDNYDLYGYKYKIDSKSKKFNDPVASSTTIQSLTVEQVNIEGTYHKKYLYPSAKKHHIGQIRVINEAGKRYVFGLPAYNNLQKEVSFSVNGIPDNNHLVSYSQADNSTGNKKGLDHFYSSTSLPPFAYAYYLTDVLSADFVDLTNDGPSPDDYGNYVRFHSNLKIPNYQWRTPFQKSQVQFDEQLLSLSGSEGDDKGHYVYGNRDVWYVDSLTSKTQIAVFHTSPRNDAYEVYDENGGMGSRTLYKIDSISLYNIHDYRLLKDEAYPQLRAHFVYDYFLCPGIPNNKYFANCQNPDSCGKLTLKELFFTYGSSYKGKHSGYKFSYGFNPPYSMVNYDRWGIFKDNNPSCPNYYFPYSIQNKTQRDKDVSAWLLSKIELPSGGFIEVNYESDDYHFVQDKEAMRMFKVIGASYDTSSAAPISNVLFNNPYLFFDLEEYSATKSEAYNAMSKMINGNIAQNLYFKFKVNVDKPPATKDFVFGYGKMTSHLDYGVTLINGVNRGWIKLKEVPIDDPGSDYINPISRAAMQFCRLNTPKYAFDQVNIQDIASDPVNALKDILKNANLLDQLVKFAQGPNGSLKAKDIGKFFDISQSWVRFQNPGTGKLGGSARVKKMTFNNNWSNTQGSEPSQFQEQEFIYELEDGSSSGVATYEPLMGGDEIPHHLPVNFSDDVSPSLPPWARTLAPHNSYMKEEPFGEMAFPPAEIGYSRVVIKNSVPSGFSSPGTGFTVYEFNTAKDFPVITKRTAISHERRKWQNKFTIFSKEIKDYLTASQGYVIELNNMHGKPKQTATYNAAGSIINESKNEYFQLGEGIKILKPDGKIILDTLGLEEDMVADFRQQETITESQSTHANVGAFNISFIFLIIPLLTQVTESEKLRFRSATTTRIIYKYAILKKQIVSDLGAKVETENLVFNPVTGAPVMTKINNQYLDPVYSFSNPAEDIYRGMASAGFNVGTHCKLTTNPNGQITSAGSFFIGGDELLDMGDGKIYWVKELNTGKFLIGKDGSTAGNFNGRNMKIVRSGHKNLIGNSAGDITCLENPLVNTGVNSWKIQADSNSKIINSTALTYSEGYQEHCFSEPGKESCTITPWGKAIENLFNNLLNTPGCPFFSSSPAILHTYGSNSPPTIDTLLVNYFNPNSIVGPMMYIKWKMAVITPDKYQASIYLETEGVQSKLCKINFSFSCKLNIQALKSALCNKTLILKPDADCNAFSIFSLSENSSCGNSTLKMNLEAPCFTLFEKEFQAGYNCGIASNIITNPYRHNLLGTWHPDKQYAMITERAPASLSNPGNLRTDGYYESFFPFWKNTNNGLLADTVKWTKTNTLTLTNPNGNAVEAMDALNRYSSTLLGYNDQLPIATAINSMYREIASENFEDYYPGFQYEIPQSDACYHFKFADYAHKLALDTAHTGHYSIRIDPSESINIDRPISPLSFCPDGTTSPPFGGSGGPSSCNCLGIFSPVEGENTKFVLSYWQKSGKAPDKISYSPALLKPINTIAENDVFKIKPEIRIDSLVIPLKWIYASGEIEGWVKEEYEFTVPASASSDIKFSFINPDKSAGKRILYLDDIRIHPFDATMKTFVYNPFTHQLMATLDENNFAAIYQYDEEGNLQEIIRETEKGRVYSEYYKKELGLR